MSAPDPEIAPPPEPVNESAPTIGDILERSRSLPRPRNFYVGTRNLLDRLPNDILVFFERRDLTGDQVWAHHRFVLATCLQGAGDIVIDGQIHHLQPGRAVLVFPYQSHHYAAFKDPPFCWMFLTFELHEEKPIAALRHHPVTLGGEMISYLCEVIHGVADYLATDRTPSAFSGRSRKTGLYLGLLLSALLEEQPPSHPASEVDTDHETTQLQRVVTHIHTHLHQPITLEKLAAISHQSLSHFRRSFRTRMGVSPGSYIRHARINKATGLLQRSSLTITQISATCGFGSVFAFSRAFKQVTGQSPQDYRQSGRATRG